MKRFGRMILAGLTVLSLVPLTGIMVGCEKDESKEVLEENYNPNVQNSQRRQAAEEERAEQERIDAQQK